MNVAIVGSRSFEDYARLAKCVAEVLADRRILMSEVQVISGGAVGVDALAERYSREVLGKEPHIFAAGFTARFWHRSCNTSPALSMGLSFSAASKRGIAPSKSWAKYFFNAISY